MDEPKHISVRCPCGKRLKAPSASVGRKAKCPTCGAILTVKPEGEGQPAPPSSNAASSHITNTPPPALPARPPLKPPRGVASPNRAAASSGSLIPASVQEEIDQANEADADAFDAIYDLADKEALAGAAAEAADPTSRCPHCGRSLHSEDVICTNCGYDTRNRTKIVTDAAPQRGISGQPRAGRGSAGAVDKMAPEGSIWLGTLVSVGGALLCSAVWFAAAYFFDRDIYLLEMLVGVGAGLGMQIGQRGYSNAGGAVAAIVTLFALVAARIGVVVAVLLPLVVAEIRSQAAIAAPGAAPSPATVATTGPATGSSPGAAPQPDDSEVTSRDPRVAKYIADVELQLRGIEPESDKYFDEIDSAMTRGEQKLRKLTRAEYLSMLPRVEQHEIRELLIEIQMDQELRSMGLNPDFQRIEPDNYPKARARIRQRVDKLSPAAQKAELKKRRAQFVAELEQSTADAKNPPSTAPTNGTGGGAPSPAAPAAGTSGDADNPFSALLFLIFRPMAVLFAIFSMATAYKVASGVTRD